jgi:hypothetical protein
MKMMKTVLMLLTAMSLLGCASGRSGIQAQPIRARLTWSESKYMLDGKLIGDYTALQKHITKMPAGSTIMVGPYHESGRYHFDKVGLKEFCRKHGVRLAKPLAR